MLLYARFTGLLPFGWACCLSSSSPRFPPGLSSDLHGWRGLELNFHRTVELLFGAAAVAGLYGVFNASWTRITRTTVQLANLPHAWRGRTAALISDVHLGHVRNGSFLRRMVAKMLKERPDAIFIAGDLYDGTAIDAQLSGAIERTCRSTRGVFRCRKS